MRRALSSFAEFVDRTWPWPPLALLAAAVVVFAGSYVAGPGPSDGEQVNDVVERFGIAVANSDGKDACALATPAAQRRFVGSIGRLGCSDVVRNFGVGVPGRELRDAPKSVPVVAGQRATVELGSVGVRLLLAREDGEWRIDALQRFAARPRR